MEAGQKLLLYEWVYQVRKLYPQHEVFNPYGSQLTALSSRVTSSESTLLYETVNCMTLLNQYSRSHEGMRIMSSREDVINGMQLFLTLICGFQKSTLRFYASLSEHFTDTSFSYQDVCLKLNCGYSTAKRKLSPLLTVGFVEKTNQKSRSKHLMQLTQGLLTSESSPADEEDIYREAFSEWADYIGFVEF